MICSLFKFELHFANGILFENDDTISVLAFLWCEFARCWNEKLIIVLVSEFLGFGKLDFLGQMNSTKMLLTKKF